MLPKEKAIDLVREFVILDDKEYRNIDWKDAKRCAIIAVNELINMARIYDNHNVKTDKHIYTFEVLVYWQEVLSEIERL